MEEQRKDLTRAEVLRAGAAGAATLSSFGLLAACGGDDDGDSAGTPGGSTATGTADAPPAPKKGGHLRVGITGGGAQDSVDPHIIVANPDFARIKSLYDALYEVTEENEIVDALAEETEPNATGDVWTIRVKDGIEFHDGKTLGADDVVYSLSAYSDPDAVSRRLRWLEPRNISKVDERTVRLTLDKPYGLVKLSLAALALSIMREDNDPKNPVGTGAFSFDTFTAGERSNFKRNESYWRDVWVDTLEIIDFDDSTALHNALVSNQVDMIDTVPFTQIPVIERTADLKLLVSEAGTWRPFCMRVDVPPFDDPKLRQAMRLVVDRQAMLDGAFQGNGTIGNDLYAPYDPAYNSDLPQREQDLEQAKSLFAEAGVKEFTLDCADVAAGSLESAQILVEQAQGAGVTIKLRKTDPGTFYGEKYLTYPFSVDAWGGPPFMYQVQQILRTNECHWADGRDGMSEPEREWLRVIGEAQTTLEDGTRTDLIQQAQQIEYDSGGYIVWAFANVTNAMRANVYGLKPDKYGNDLNYWRFYNAYFA